MSPNAKRPRRHQQILARHFDLAGEAAYATSMRGDGAPWDGIIEASLNAMEEVAGGASLSFAHGVAFGLFGALAIVVAALVVFEITQGIFQ